MAVEDYTKLMKKALDARKNNKKAWEGAKKDLTAGRGKLKSYDAAIRDLLIKVKGLQAHANDVYSQWEDLAHQIIDLQKVAKADKTRAAEIEKKIAPLHKQAQVFREQFGTAINDFPVDHIDEIKKVVDGMKI